MTTSKGMAMNSPRMTKVSTKLRKVVFFADLSMDLAVDNHQIKQRKIAIGMHVLNGKSMSPVVADCVFW